MKKKLVLFFKKTEDINVICSTLKDFFAGDNVVIETAVANGELYGEGEPENFAVVNVFLPEGSDAEAMLEKVWEVCRPVRGFFGEV